MSLGLRLFLLIVDVGFVIYWIVTIFGLIPPEYLYSNYNDPNMVAWNWSFLPLDFAISLTGLTALKLNRRGDKRWVPLVLVSLSFTCASGLNAISFWVVQKSFDATWWIPNLALMLLPWVFIPSLLS